MKIKKSVSVSEELNQRIKEVTNELNISDNTLIVLAIQKLLRSQVIKEIKKGALDKSDLIEMVLYEE